MSPESPADPVWPSMAPVSGPCSKPVQAKPTSNSNDRIDRLRIDAAECTSAPLLLIDSRGCILWTNRQLRELLGYTTESLIGRSLSALMTGADETQVTILWNFARELAHSRDQTLCFSAQLRCDDGRTIPTLVRLVLAGTPVDPCAVVTLTDATATLEMRHQLDELRYQCAAINHLQVTQFLAGSILHDFNNILAGIGGHVRWAQEVAKPEEIQETLSIIQQATGRASELLQRLRGGPGTRSCSSSGVSWQRVLKEAMELLRGAIPRQVLMRWTLCDDTPPIDCSESEAHQIIMNLGMNAAAAMRADGGTLTVTLTRVQIDAADATHEAPAAGTYACLSVRDTGLGMDEETRTRIFDPFFSTKNSPDIQGLGLSIVRSTVSRYGGFIELDSCVGVGTEFRVYLPCHPGCPAELRD